MIAQNMTKVGKVILRPLLIALYLVAGQPLGLLAGDRQPIEFFEAKVRPLLIEHCYECHSTESGESAGNLRLDSAAAVRAGGSMGQPLVPGKPNESLIIKAVSYEDNDLQMPPTEKLDNEAIAVLKQWIAIGAPDPREETSPAKHAAASPLERDPQTHWAFVPPLPQVPNRPVRIRYRWRISPFLPTSRSSRHHRLKRQQQARMRNRKSN